MTIFGLSPIIPAVIALVLFVGVLALNARLDETGRKPLPGFVILIALIVFGTIILAGVGMTISNIAWG